MQKYNWDKNTFDFSTIKVFFPTFYIIMEIMKVKIKILSGLINMLISPKMHLN